MFPLFFTTACLNMFLQYRISTAAILFLVRYILEMFCTLVTPVGWVWKCSFHQSGHLEKQRTVASGMECSKPPEMSLLAKCGTADIVWESRYRSRLAIHVSMRWAICTNAKSLGHYIYSYFATEAASKSYGIGQNLTYNPYLLFVHVWANYGKSLCGICTFS